MANPPMRWTRPSLPLVETIPFFPQHPRSTRALIRRWTMLLVLAIGTITPKAVAADLPSAARTLIEKRCLDCHDSDTKKGNLDLTALQPEFTNPDTFARWVKVHDRVRDGEMPPPKKEQPSPKDREAAVKSLADLLTAADSKRQR